MNATNRTPRVGVGQAPKAPATPRVTPRGRYPVDGSGALRAQPATTQAPRLRVAPPTPVAVPRAPFVALVLVLVIGGVVGILVLNTKINENAFLLAGLHKESTALDERQEQLDRELAALSSAGNLEAAAKKLGLVPADDPAHLRLPDGRVFGVPRPASGEPSVTSQTGQTGQTTSGGR